MTLPTIVTVKAVIQDSSGPVAGRITWQRNTSLLPASSSDQAYAIPEEVVSVVAADGILSQPLFSNNDPVASPTGWTWTVIPHFPHWRGSFDIVVPYNAADGEVNLNTLAPVPPDGTGALYSLSNHTHSGGGGGGSVDSVFGRTGAVTAQSGDYTKAQVGLSNVDNTADASKSFAASQVTSGTLAIARVPTGTSGTTVALGNAPAAAVTTHEAASDPHTQYSTIRYWNGSSYDIVAGANVYVGGTGPVSPTNGDIVFPT